MIWIHLRNLPLTLWTLEALQLIVARARHLVKLDQVTRLLSKRRFVRVTLEIDLLCLLVPCTDIDIKGKDIPNFWEVFWIWTYSFVLLPLWSCRLPIFFLQITSSATQMVTLSAIAPPKPNDAEVEMPSFDSLTPVTNDDIRVFPLPWIHIQRGCRNPRSAAAEDVPSTIRAA